MFSQMSEIELTITTLKNGVNLISLLDRDSQFDCGTLAISNAGVLNIKLRNISRPIDYDFDKDAVSAVVGNDLVEQGDFKLQRRLILPDIDSYELIMELVPPNCLVLVREYIAEAWGFPFVCPVYSGQDKAYSSSCFYSA